MHNHSVKNSLLLPLLAIALVALFILGMYSIHLVGQITNKNISDRIDVALESQKIKSETYLNNTKSALTVLASGLVANRAMDDLLKAVNRTNPTTAASKGEVLPTHNTSMYQDAYKKYHPFFLDFVRNHNLSDLLLIAPGTGLVIYSTSKEFEPGRRVTTGEQKDRPLGKVVAKVLFEDADEALSIGDNDNDMENGYYVYFGRPIVKKGVHAGAVILKAPAENMLNADAGGVTFWISDSLAGTVITSTVSNTKNDRLNNMETNSESPVKSVNLNLADHKYLLNATTTDKHSLISVGKLKAVFVYCVALLLLGALFVLRLGGRKLDMPVKQLSMAMKDLAESGYPPEEPISHPSNDEIGVLYELFNDITTSLSNRAFDTETREKSAGRRANTLAKKLDEIEGQVKSQEAKTTIDNEQMAQLYEKNQLQEKELDKLGEDLDLARNYLEEVNDVQVNFVVAVEDRLKSKLASIIKVLKTGLFSENSVAIAIKDCNALDRSLDETIMLFTQEYEFKSLSIEKVNVGKLAKQVVDNFKEDISLKKLRFQLEIKSKDTTILADKEQIRIIMENLVENAINFTLQGGSVLVMVMASATHVRFEVRDTGVGLEKVELQSIFEKFSKANKTSDSRMAGLGLGLYVSRMLVRRHDGKIGAESEREKGSMFFFEIAKERSLS